MSLLLEDVLFTSDLAQKTTMTVRGPSTIPQLSHYSQTLFTKGSRRSLFGKMQQATTSKPLPNLPPVSVNKLITKFLMIAIQVEKLRHVWGCSLLGTTAIDSFENAKHLNNIFSVKVGAFARRQVVKRTARSLMKMQVENVRIIIIM